MSMAAYDWGEIAKSAPKGFEPAPAGTYTVECTDADPKTFSTGSQGVSIEVTIEDEGPAKGKKIKFVTIVFNPENPGTFMGQLRAFGIGPEFFSEYGKFDSDDAEFIGEVMEDVADEIVGKRAIAPVTQDTYEGRVNNKVGFFKPVGSVKTGGRKRRGGTPYVGGDEPAAEAPKRGRRAAAAADPDPDDGDGDGGSDDGDAADSEGEAPKRTRAGRSRRSKGEPGLPPGL